MWNCTCQNNNTVCIRCIRRWCVNNMVKFWRRTNLITVLLCQFGLVLLFIQYTACTSQTIRNGARSVYQSNSFNMASNNNPIHMASNSNSIKVPSNNSPNERINYTKSRLPTCPVVPPWLSGHISVDTTEYSEKDLAARLPFLETGGTYRPDSCASRHRVAVIVPYRNRRTHLHILLNNLHPFLQKQQLDYGIFVIELAPSVNFNKAVLMNIGFIEVARRYGYQCFIFHDVDLIPENDNNIYSCPDNPRHLSVAIDKFDYELPYMTLFGGVTAMSKEQFEAVNGYSNKYFGWGGEDDDMYARIRSVGLAVYRYTSDVSVYRMLNHPPTEINEQRHQLLQMGMSRWKDDGLNTIKYEVLQIVRKPLYTYILADIDQDDKPYRMWERPPFVQEPMHFLDTKVEAQLIKKAKYLLNTTEIDPRVYSMLIIEFLVSRSSSVTTEHVAEILKKILPSFRLSPETIQRVNDFRDKKPSMDTNIKPLRLESKPKNYLFSNSKMSLMANNIKENVEKAQQKAFENVLRHQLKGKYP